MAVQNQKKKLLCLMQILLEATDEEHIMSAADLCKALEGYGIYAERKSIYAYIEALSDWGMDIVQVKGRHPGYYVGSRDFELPELKLLVDAVQSSKFITTRKSEELIKKLESLTSKYEARTLQRQVFIYNRPKTGNETIFYNVDYIHTAILENVQIQFQYTEWTEKKKLRVKKGGAFYQVSPWALTWSDENYYLIAYDAEKEAIRYYRVDKMKNVSLLSEPRLGKTMFQNFDLAAFAKKTFSMYGGRDEEVVLVCKNAIAGVFLDRYGTDIMLIPVDEEHFKVKVLVAVSPQFFGWVTGLGDMIQIVGPKNVVEEYQNYLETILKRYSCPD